MVELGEIAPGKWMAGFQMYPLNEGFKERSIILVALTVSSAAFCVSVIAI